MSGAGELEAMKLRRLIFAKDLFRRAVEQSREPEPLAYASLIGLHDAVELWLVVACDQLTANKQDMKFVTYFDKIAESLGRQLAHRGSMLRLNNARNQIKHYGTWPNMAEVAGFAVSAGAFFDENTPLVFARSFAELSLASLVRGPRVRQHLETAERYISTGELEGAIREIGISFAYLRADTALRDADRFRTKLPPLEMELKLFGGELRRVIERLGAELEDVRASVQLIAWGVDLARLRRFEKLTPRYRISVAGTPVGGGGYRAFELTRTHVQFCYDFAIECALVIQRDQP